MTEDARFDDCCYCVHKGECNDTNDGTCKNYELPNFPTNLYPKADMDCNGAED